MGIRRSRVDAAICRYLEALASTLPPSPIGRQLEMLQQGLVHTGTSGPRSSADSRLDTLAERGWCMSGLTNEDLAILASRYWARSWVTRDRRITLRSGKVITVSEERRPSVLTYKLAADWLGIPENQYRQRLTVARNKVIANMEGRQGRQAA